MSSTYRHRSVNCDVFQSNGASSGKDQDCCGLRWFSAEASGGALHRCCSQSVVASRFGSRSLVRRIQWPVNVIPRPSSTITAMKAVANVDDKNRLAAGLIAVVLGERVVITLAFLG
jgi:hypothetical protein